ncbi:MAG TPA: hypothetical protein VJ810_05765 [Blastocatellia bacterium]|nr:hypothetical protein [Blastocatellia bacterium]
MLRDDARSIYRPGQVWGYRTRPCDEQSYLIVVRVDDALELINIVHICIEGVRVKDPLSEQWTVKTIGHMPIAEEALSASVTEMLGVTTQMPDFQEGYETWRTNFDNSQAGYFTTPVAVCVDMVAQAIEGATPMAV